MWRDKRLIVVLQLAQLHFQIALLLAAASNATDAISSAAYTNTLLSLLSLLAEIRGTTFLPMWTPPPKESVQLALRGTSITITLVVIAGTAANRMKYLDSLATSCSFK